jgi:hypothetical protein
VTGLLDDLRRKVDDTLKLAGAGAVVAAAATAAFICFAVALFLWTQQRYGSLEAWLALGGLFAFVTVVGSIVLLVFVRRRARAPARSSAASRLLQDPAVVLAGLHLVRTLGARQFLPTLLIAAVAGGLLMGIESPRNGRSHPRSESGPAGQK